MDPTVQGQQPPAETAKQEQAPVSGAETRINELTAKFRDAERQMAVLAERENQYLSLIQQLTQAPASQIPEPQIDPALAAAIESKTSPLLRQLEATVKRLESQLAQSQVAQMAPQFDLPDNVASYAQRAMADWKQRGIPGTVEDAIDWAWGRVMREDKMAQRKNGATRQQFSGGSPVHGAPGHAPNVAPPQSQNRPQNFENLSPAQQIAWFENNRNGGDMPL